MYGVGRLVTMMDAICWPPIAPKCETPIPFPSPIALTGSCFNWWKGATASAIYACRQLHNGVVICLMKPQANLNEHWKEGSVTNKDKGHNTSPSGIAEKSPISLHCWFQLIIHPITCAKTKGRLQCNLIQNRFPISNRWFWQTQKPGSNGNICECSILKLWYSPTHDQAKYYWDGWWFVHGSDHVLPSMATDLYWNGHLENFMPWTNGHTDHMTIRPQLIS